MLRSVIAVQEHNTNAPLQDILHYVHCALAHGCTKGGYTVHLHSDAQKEATHDALAGMLRCNTVHRVVCVFVCVCGKTPR